MRPRRQESSRTSAGPPGRLSIIVPAFNEEATIQEALDNVLAAPVPLEKEILIVDDGSQDQTYTNVERWIASRPEANARLLRHERNAGKGAAVRTGIRAASGRIILIQDADLEYHPADYPALIAPIVRNATCVVYGSRVGGRRGRQWLSRRQWFANRVLTTLTNLLCGATLRDMETCYKAFRAEVIKPIRLTASGFDIEPEITIKILRAGYRILEVPITYRGRSKQQGKKITWRDGVKAVWAILRYRFCG